jgi:hypothetical protein
MLRNSTQRVLDLKALLPGCKSCLFSSTSRVPELHPELPRNESRWLYPTVTAGRDLSLEGNSYFQY